MSGGWFFGLAVLVNVASALLFVYTVRERRRIEDTRKRLRLDRIADLRSTARRPADVIHVAFPRCKP